VSAPDAPAFDEERIIWVLDQHGVECAHRRPRRPTPRGDAADHGLRYVCIVGARQPRAPRGRLKRP
jgi:hypothetical protein